MEFCSSSIWMERQLGFRMANVSSLVRPTSSEPTIGIGMYDLTNAGKEILTLYLDEDSPHLEGYFANEVSGLSAG